MDGLIVKQPWANDIISGKKKVEYRSNKLPDSKKWVYVYLLSGGKALGKIRFEGYNEHSTGYEWIISKVEPFSSPKPYIHPHGARVWVTEVVLDE